MDIPNRALGALRAADLTVESAMKESDEYLLSLEGFGNKALLALRRKQALEGPSIERDSLGDEADTAVASKADRYYQVLGLILPLISERAGIDEKIVAWSIELAHQVIAGEEVARS